MNLVENVLSKIDLEKKLSQLEIFKNVSKIERGLEFYAVGGCIRDIILGLNPNDVDVVVVGSTPDDMINRGFKQVGIDFPVFLHPKTGDEWALARQERSTGVGTNDFSVDTDGITISEDLFRRDLTINAMAYNPKSGLVDPYNGFSDINNNILRNVSEAFSEDPLRALRVARFSARYPDFIIHDDTLKIMESQADGLKIIAKERIWKELKKCLGYEKPSNYFRVLKDLNLLEIVHPVLHSMIGIEQTIIHHAEGDVFEHSMRVLDKACEATSNEKIRYGALYHDIGKPTSFKEDGNFHNHYKYDVVSKQLNILKKQKHPKDYIRIAEIAALNHHFVHKFNSLRPGTIAKRFLQIPKFKDGVTIPTKFPKTEFEMSTLCIISYSDNSGRIVSDSKEQSPLSFEEVDKIFEVNDDNFFIEFAHLDKSYDISILENLQKMFKLFIDTKVVYPEEFLKSKKEDKKRLYAEFKMKHTIDLILSIK